MRVWQAILLVSAVSAVTVAVIVVGRGSSVTVQGSTPAAETTAKLVLPAIRAAQNVDVQRIVCTSMVGTAYRCLITTPSTQIVCSTNRSPSAREVTTPFCLPPPTAAQEQQRRAALVARGLQLLGANAVQTAGASGTTECMAGFRMVGNLQSDDVVVQLDATAGYVTQFAAMPDGTLSVNTTHSAWGVNPYSSCTVDSTGIHLTGQTHDVSLLQAIPEVNGSGATVPRASRTAPTSADAPLVEEAAQAYLKAAPPCFSFIGLRFSAEAPWAVVGTAVPSPALSGCPMLQSESLWLEKTTAWNVVQAGTTPTCPTPVPADISGCPAEESGLAQQGTPVTTTTPATQPATPQTIPASMTPLTPSNVAAALALNLPDPPGGAARTSICTSVSVDGRIGAYPIYVCWYENQNGEKGHGCYTSPTGTTRNLENVTDEVARLQLRITC